MKARNTSVAGMARRSMLTVVIGWLALAALGAPEAQAVERPEWPSVGRAALCTYQWPGDIKRKARIVFTNLEGQPHHRLRRGNLQTQLLDLRGEPEGDPFTNRVDIAWKPEETPQDPAGTTHELTVPANGIQCKRFTVKTRGGWPGCIEELVFDDCSNGIVQTCFLAKICP